jgi:DNA-binding LacI/PurR family transcriptional regulator
METRSPRPTIEDVARAAGVSRSTVSRVINGSSSVSPAALASVTSAITTLNYEPDPGAQALGRLGSR